MRLKLYSVPSDDYEEFLDFVQLTVYHNNIVCALFGGNTLFIHSISSINTLFLNAQFISCQDNKLTQQGRGYE